MATFRQHRSNSACDSRIVYSLPSRGMNNALLLELTQGIRDVVSPNEFVLAVLLMSPVVRNNSSRFSSQVNNSWLVNRSRCGHKRDEVLANELDPVVIIVSGPSTTVTSSEGRRLRATGRSSMPSAQRLQRRFCFGAPDGGGAQQIDSFGFMTKSGCSEYRGRAVTLPFSCP